jgi:hypothetical protein
MLVNRTAEDGRFYLNTDERGDNIFCLTKKISMTYIRLKE